MKTSFKILFSSLGTSCFRGQKMNFFLRKTKLTEKYRIIYFSIMILLLMEPKFLHSQQSNDFFVRRRCLALFECQLSFVFFVVCYKHLIHLIFVKGLFFPLLIVAWFLSADFLYPVAFILIIWQPNWNESSFI